MDEADEAGAGAGVGDDGDGGNVFELDPIGAAVDGIAIEELDLAEAEVGEVFVGETLEDAEAGGGFGAVEALGGCAEAPAEGEQRGEGEEGQGEEGCGAGGRNGFHGGDDIAAGGEGKEFLE